MRVRRDIVSRSAPASDVDGNDPSGNDSLTLAKLMKKYRLSRAQLIQLIRDRYAHASQRNQLTRSLINSTSSSAASRAIQRKTRRRATCLNSSALLFCFSFCLTDVSARALNISVNERRISSSI